MQAALDKPWDTVWVPTDLIGLTTPESLVEPLEIRPGGYCRCCGSTDVTGLTILVKPAADLFEVDLDDPKLHYELVKVFAVMVAAPWHKFLAPTTHPERMRAWMSDINRINGESGYAKGDVGDAVSDRWSRYMPELMGNSVARQAFGEAVQGQVEYKMHWPPDNVHIFVPGEDLEGPISGFKPWDPRG